jgi:hypothetical protein
MRIFKPALATATIGLLSLAAPASSQSGATTTTVHASMISGAVVLPTPEQVQAELNVVGGRIRSEQASFYSPPAESGYLDAERDFKLWQYDYAADAASQSGIPNRKSRNSTAQD